MLYSAWDFGYTARLPLSMRTQGEPLPPTPTFWKVLHFPTASRQPSDRLGLGSLLLLLHQLIPWRHCFFRLHLLLLLRTLAGGCIFGDFIVPVLALVLGCLGLLLSQVGTGNQVLGDHRQ